MNAHAAEIRVHTRITITRDNIAFTGIEGIIAAVGADAVEFRASDNVNAAGPVGHCHKARDIQPDQVTGNHIEIGAGVCQLDAMGIVSRNDVSFGGVIHAISVGADDVGLRSAKEIHTDSTIRQSSRAGGISANEISLDCVPAFSCARHLMNGLNFRAAQCATVQGGFIHSPREICRIC